VKGAGRVRVCFLFRETGRIMHGRFHLFIKPTFSTYRRVWISELLKDGFICL
jgi:hypothetical protein